MKKTFLIAGLIAGIGATNGYADIVISQPDDNSDMVVTVARAAKGKTRVAPQPTKTYEPIIIEDEKDQAKAASGAGVNVITCPEGCGVVYKVLKDGTIAVWCEDFNGRECESKVSSHMSVMTAVEAHIK